MSLRAPRRFSTLRWLPLAALLAPALLPSAAAGQEPSREERRMTRLIEESLDAWAFRPVRRPEVPATRDAAWVRGPIDAFILARLEANGLAPAPPASRVALLRRVYYDLIGLPPSPAQVEAFLADETDHAYERVVDELLRSERYGERWGRHWLDLVRFAETNSFERDSVKPNAWRFRDYVIESFNADKPFDRFILEQLAGDELDEVTSESIIATGYYRLGPWDDEPTDLLQARYDELDDIVSTTGQVFLGMTIGCARCHDHKIDPLPQKDYYRLLAFFHNIQPTRRGDDDTTQATIAAAENLVARQREVEALESRRREVRESLEEMERTMLAKLDESERAKATDERSRRRLLASKLAQLLCEQELDVYKSLSRDLERLERTRLSPLPQALAVREAGATAPETFVLQRGSAHAPGEKVEPGFPVVLGGGDAVIRATGEGAASSGRRRALAEWIARPDNPLTARVLANRVWQHHFGRGIVRSSNNFGRLGDPPTHPELLDWLAAELVAGGWRLKGLHRTIVTSSAYRMSSAGDAEALAKDPTNDLFWRFDMRRLEAEAIRDSILAVNGTLNLRMGGPGFYTRIPNEILQGQSRPGEGWGESSDEERARRSVYIHIKRSLVTPILATFDAADTDSSCAVRFATTQPTQALSMLNSDFMIEQSRIFAARLRREAGASVEAQVRHGLALALGRPARRGDVDAGLRLIEDLRRDEGLSPEAALEQFCLLVYNLNEFIYLD